MKITPKNKAKELYIKFRTMVIDSENGRINDEIANACALMCVKEIRKELDYYAGIGRNGEQRPFDLSGKDFWKEVDKEMQQFQVG